MKQFIFSFTLIFCLVVSSSAQKYPLKKDVNTLEGILKAYYEVVSGPAGQPRQVERDMSLHMPDAQIVIVRNNDNGEVIPNRMTLAEYYENSTSLVETGFFEHEISRVVQRHGSVAHVWSTYEWKATEDGPIGGRGINSIQLYHDGNRWWITSWMYDGRSPAPEVPKEYMPKK